MKKKAIVGPEIFEKIVGEMQRAAETEGDHRLAGWVSSLRLMSNIPGKGAHRRRDTAS